MLISLNKYLRSVKMSCLHLVFIAWFFEINFAINTLLECYILMS